MDDTAIDELRDRMAAVEAEISDIKAQLAPVKQTAEQVDDIFEFVQKARSVFTFLARWAIRFLKTLPATAAGFLFLYGLIQGWF